MLKHVSEEEKDESVFKEDGKVCAITPISLSYRFDLI